MYPKYLVYIFIVVMCIWAFWPIFDFIQVLTGKLPPKDKATIDDIVAIKSKGTLYRYSALKRFKSLPENKKKGYREMIDSFNALRSA